MGLTERNTRNIFKIGTNFHCYFEKIDSVLLFQDSLFALENLMG